MSSIEPFVPVRPVRRPAPAPPQPVPRQPVPRQPVPPQPVAERVLVPPAHREAEPEPERRGDERADALGPLLAPYSLDPTVTDLLVDGRGALWIDRGSGLRSASDWRTLAPAEARALAAQLVAAGGRHLDDAAPCVDVRLPGGLRVHAVLPPVTTGGALVSIRLARARPWRLDDLGAVGMLDASTAARLRDAVAGRRNVLVCGPAGAGKTALLGALLAEVPPTERIVTIEDVAELEVAHPHVVGLETRQPNGDGAGGIDLRRLVREALRMRPDRIVVGECRGAEVADLLAALNTGHDGGAATVHSTSLHDLPARLEALGALAGLDAVALARQARSAIHLVVQIGRTDGVRRVVALGRLTGARRLEVEVLP